MRDLEMKALQDPFVADALEGAESIGADEFAKDVESLNKKISSGKTGKYIWPLRIAASIALILTITFIVIQISPNTKSDQLALQQNEKAEENPAPIFTDTIKEGESPVKESGQEEEPKNITAKKPEVSQPETEITRLTQEPKTQPETQLAQSSALKEADQAKDVAIADEREEVATKSIAEQSSLSEKARSQAQESSPSPTSISGAGVARKKTAKGDIAAKDAIESPSTYQQYLKTNVVYPKAALDSKVEGEVKVSFMVKQDGTLSEFVVEKGIGFGCDEELIRLIKAGPPWQPASARQRVTFDFVLPDK